MPSNYGVLYYERGKYYWAVIDFVSYINVLNDILILRDIHCVCIEIMREREREIDESVYIAYGPAS